MRCLSHLCLDMSFPSFVYFLLLRESAPCTDFSEQQLVLTCCGITLTAMPLYNRHSKIVDMSVSRFSILAWDTMHYYCYEGYSFGRCKLVHLYILAYQEIQSLTTF